MSAPPRQLYYLDFSAQKRLVVHWAEPLLRRCLPSDVFDLTPEKLCRELESLDQYLDIIGANDHIIVE